MTEEATASQEIDRLLAEAARDHNKCYRTGIKFHFDPSQNASLISAKQNYGSPRLLECLLHFKCQGDGRFDIDTGEQTYGDCKKLAIIFVPKEDCPHEGSDDDDEEEEEEPGDYQDPRPECPACYEFHADRDAIRYVWSGRNAEHYYGLDGLQTIMKHGGRAFSILRPFPLCRHFAANQTTWAAMLLVRGDIWKIYWSLIQRHAPPTASESD